MAVPTDNPLMIPDAEPTEMIPLVPPLLHTPPGSESLNTVVWPMQTPVLPVIADGYEPTVKVTDAIQPESTW